MSCQEVATRQMLLVSLSSSSFFFTIYSNYYLNKQNKGEKTQRETLFYITFCLTLQSTLLQFVRQSVSLCIYFFLSQHFPIHIIMILTCQHTHFHTITYLCVRVVCTTQTPLQKRQIMLQLFLSLPAKKKLHEITKFH